MSFSSYGDYSSDNYGVNSLVFLKDGASYFFSYKTLVAVQKFGRLIIRKNVWGNTTGKHLNWIDADKSIRVNKETFEKQVKELLK
jgi:hypothetical protein